jgi:hypothetical protein
MIWNVQLKLERPDEFKKDDESWFDEEHMRTEIITWLEDLDYTVTDVKIINECASQDLEPSGKQRSKRQDKNKNGALAYLLKKIEKEKKKKDSSHPVALFKALFLNKRKKKWKE